LATTSTNSTGVNFNKNNSPSEPSKILFKKYIQISKHQKVQEKLETIHDLKNKELLQ